MKPRTIRDIAVGETYSFTVKVDEALVDQFARMSGDYNPLHMDAAYAATTPFGARVVHGMLAGSFISTLIGMHLPGPGSLWLSQNFEFLLPVRLNDVLTIEGVVARKSETQGILFIDVRVSSQNGMEVLKGEGKVKLIEEPSHMVTKPLKECRVLVTGASRGLGAAIALKFGQEGAHVLVNYCRSKDKAQAVADQIRQHPGGRADLIEGDLTTPQGIDQILKQVGASGVDVLVFSGLGDLKQGMLLDQSLEDFERALDYGMRASVRLLHGILPGMVERKFGRIISILSTYAVGVPPAGFSSYVVNKKALEAITKSVAVEYGKHNICANMVSPNMLRTDLTAATPERAKQLLEAQTPLKRLASLDEVAGNVVYLCSPPAAYVNGHNLVISGGSTII